MVAQVSHTPPEGWVRAKKKYITFDTNFGRYLPRGTIIDGSLKCRIRAFCTIAKISGEIPKKIWHHFGLFLSLFLAFHLKFLQLCKKPPSYISGTHQSLFPLVNNGQNWCQKLCTFFSPLLILQGVCVLCLKCKSALGTFNQEKALSG